MAASCDVELHDASFIEEQKWIYLAEGNRNIVLAAPDTGFVLRLKKKSKNSSAVAKEKNTLCKSENSFRFEHEFDFYQGVVKPLIGREQYLVDRWSVNLRNAFIQRTSNVIDQFRPSHRRGKVIDLECYRAVLMQDASRLVYPRLLSSGGSICIEIKPKWGSLPSNVYHSNAEEHEGVCYYCMLQHFKLSTDKVDTVSPYCPLDLFSKHSCMVMHAIYCLFDTPQNNIKIFSGDVQIYPTQGGECGLHALSSILREYVSDDFKNHSNDVGSVYSLAALLLEVFYQDSHGNKGISTTEACNDHNHDCNEGKRKAASINKQNTGTCSQMGELGLLTKIKSIQDVDISGIDIVTRCYHKLLNSTADGRQEGLHEDLARFTSTEWKGLVSHIWSSNDFFPIANSSCHELKKVLQDKAVMTDVVKRFLVSRTFQDCSIMITLQRADTVVTEIPHTLGAVTCSSGSTYLYQMKVVDTDPKAAEDIPYYYKLNEEIISNYHSCQHV